MNSNFPRLPRGFLLVISILLSFLFAPKLNKNMLLSMLDFIGMIASILFTAFGIWISVIDPKKVLILTQKSPNINDEDSVVYQLCYYLVCCTFILISVIFLNYFALTYAAWHSVIQPYTKDIKSFPIILKIVSFTFITFLYLCMLWIAIAVLSPAIRTMSNYRNICIQTNTKDRAFGPQKHKKYINDSKSD